MSDDLLPYFEAEHAALMRLAGKLPVEVAGRLRISAHEVADPHVERLLEGVAYLGARVQARLDDEFPELTDGLLGILYPQMLAPIPSCMMVQLLPDKSVDKPVTVERHTAVAHKIGNGSCRFRTASPVRIWPIEIDEVRLMTRPSLPFANPMVADPAGVLRLSLRCRDPKMEFKSLAGTEKQGLGSLRLHFQGAHAAALHELVCGHVRSVAVVNMPTDGRIDPNPKIVDHRMVQAGGFEETDALIPWPAQGFAGFRLLSEYFTLPEKFLCADLHGLGAVMQHVGNRMDLLLYLDKLPPELERAVTKESVALNCVPVVNLFSRRCEPIDLDWTRTEYRVDPDRSQPEATEVWMIEEVRETQLDGSSQPWRKLFRQGARGVEADMPGYLPVIRPAAGQLDGTETYLAVDVPSLDVRTATRSRLSVQALCTNRDLPASLPVGRGQPALKLEKGVHGLVPDVIPLSAPTPTLRPPARGRRAWQLISNMSMSHLSVVGGTAGAEVLREALQLYDLRNTAETRNAISSLLAVDARDGVARLPASRPRGNDPEAAAREPVTRSGIICRGTDVTLTFSAASWRSGGLFLLASVLAQFLRLHATVNSFVRVTARLNDGPDAVAKWPALSGTRELL